MNIIERLTIPLQYGAAVCLVGMVAITCADVIGNAFGNPILGTEEITSLAGSIFLAFGLAYTEYHKGHIGVDILYRRFPAPLKRTVSLITSMASAGFFLLAAWQSVTYAAEMTEKGVITETLGLPIQYVIYCVAVGCFILTLVMILEILFSFKERAHE
jgi:TRAP-type C4-dicarboxylate transport system permease small subunit